MRHYLGFYWLQSQCIRELDLKSATTTTEDKIMASENGIIWIKYELKTTVEKQIA